MPGTGSGTEGSTEIRHRIAAAVGWPGELDQARLWFEPHPERMHEDAVLRRADLLQLEQIAAGHPSGFLILV